MPHLYSIESLDPANIIETMNRPVIVHASDLEYYFCKYNRFASRAYRLFKEQLIAGFLPLWNFNSSLVNIVQVKDEHIPEGFGVKRNHFNYPCFGLQKVPFATELDKHNIDLLNKKLDSTFKAEFLRLAFFDIWVANEDRSHNNYNILLQAGKAGYKLFPIDHEACLNHADNCRTLIPITYEESLVYSEAFATLFDPGTVQEALASLRVESYLCMQACQTGLGPIMSSVPPEWQIDIPAETRDLAEFLLEDDWFDEAWETFETYINYFRTA